MSKGNHRFKQGDVTKAIKGAVRAGLEIQRVEIDQAGKIVVFAGKPVDPSKADVGAPGLPQILPEMDIPEPPADEDPIIKGVPKPLPKSPERQRVPERVECFCSCDTPTIEIPGNCPASTTNCV